MNTLSEKVALVTGASRGIGRAIALVLGREGCRVAVHYKEREGEARQVVAEIVEIGGQATIFSADMADSSPATPTSPVRLLT